MGDDEPRQPSHSSPPRLLTWWEGLETLGQIRIAFPPLAVAGYLINSDLFNQPLFQSIFYGLFEGGLITGFVLMATANERNRRKPD